MADDDRADVVRLHAGGLERRHRRRPAVDQQAVAGALEQEAGLEAAAVAERIAGADEAQGHAVAWKRLGATRLSERSRGVPSKSGRSVSRELSGRSSSVG